MVLGIGKDIGYVNRTALQNRSSEKGSPIRFGGISGETITLLFGETVCCGDRIDVTFACPENAAIRLAQANRRLNQRIQDCLEIESRPTNNLQHVSGRGLLLEGFPQFVEQ